MGLPISAQGAVPDPWTDALKQLAAKTGGSIMVDMTQAGGPLPQSKGEGLALWRPIARSLALELKPRPKALVLAFPDVAEAKREALEKVSAWLLALKPGDLDRLRAGAGGPDLLPEPVADAIGRLLPATASGMGDSSTRLRLGRDTHILYTDEQGRRRMEVVRPSSELSQVAPPDNPPVPKSTEKTPVPGDDLGTLDLGAGKTISLAELVLEAKAKFKTDYASDPRLATLPVFVAGKWSRASFDDAVGVLTKVAPTQPLTMLLTGDEALLALDPSSKEDPRRNMVSGKTTVGSVLGTYPNSLRNAASLSPGTEVELVSAVGLFISVAQPNGVRIEYFLPVGGNKPKG